MKRAFALAVILSLFLAESKAYDSRPAITVEDLKTMQPLPGNAKVTGTITALDKGFGHKLAFVVKLDKFLTCELIQVGPASLELEKRGETLVFAHTNSRGGAFETKTLLVGQQATVTGVISKKPNGSIVLKGTMQGPLNQ